MIAGVRPDIHGLKAERMRLISAKADHEALVNAKTRSELMDYHVAKDLITSLALQVVSQLGAIPVDSPMCWSMRVAPQLSNRNLRISMTSSASPSPILYVSLKT
jgi:phage terminase Nu1 subunit (DNA packaging protein)